MFRYIATKKELGLECPLVSDFNIKRRGDVQMNRWRIQGQTFDGNIRARGKSVNNELNMMSCSC